MINKEKGQILVLVITALGVVLFTVLFIIGGAQLYFQNALYSVNSEKAVLLAEAGIDKAVASLNETGGSYNGETETTLDEGSFSVEIADKDAANKIIKSTGYIPNKSNPKVKRAVTLQVSKGVGVSFMYGLQVGAGGITMGTGSTINGSVYSNGSISGGNNSRFTGDVYVAGAGQAEADQQSDCLEVSCQDYIFGRSEGGENRQDVAQSFRSSSDGSLNKIAVKLQRVGSPANAVVRIMSDSNGKPNKNGVLATGTLQAGRVSESAPPAFVDVTFDTSPNLENDHTYWIMIHSASLNSSNYWIWSLDFSQSYMPGVPKWSSDWQGGTWSAITGDLGFKTYMSGGVNSLNLGNNSIIDGNVHANTISGQFTISKDAYYQIIADAVTVSGTRYPASDDPAQTVFPISDANIADWKAAAETEGIINGNVTGCPSQLGPGKINGSVSLGNSCNIRVVAPVWITGSVSTGNSTKLNLDPSFGASSGMMIADGTVNLANGSDILGSGTAGSYLMLLTTFDSRSGGGSAVEIGNSSISGILYAPFGKVELANGASFKEITAWEINLGNDAVLNYQSGFASTFFSSGPSGSFSLVKRTYQVK